MVKKKNGWEGNETFNRLITFSPTTNPFPHFLSHRNFNSFRLVKKEIANAPTAPAVAAPQAGAITNVRATLRVKKQNTVISPEVRWLIKIRPYKHN